MFNFVYYTIQRVFKIGKKFSILFTFISTFLLVSVVINISSNMLAQTGSSITSGSSLVLLLDNSGSMGKCKPIEKSGKIEGCDPATEPYKINEVKEAISRRTNDSDLASTKIGLIEAGEWRSLGISETDQVNQCRAVKPLVPPTLDRNQLNGALRKIEANWDGVTPIARTLLEVIAQLQGEKTDWGWMGNLPARLLLITDGQPTCDDIDPYPVCGLIENFKSQTGGEVDLHIDIIGYKPSEKEAVGEFIRCAKKHPDVVTWLGATDTVSELEKKIESITPAPRRSIDPWCIVKGSLSLFSFLLAMLLFAIVSIPIMLPAGWSVVASIQTLPIQQHPGILAGLAAVLAAVGGILQAMPCGNSVPSF